MLKPVTMSNAVFSLLNSINMKNAESGNAILLLKKQFKNKL